MDIKGSLRSVRNAALVYRDHARTSKQLFESAESRLMMEAYLRACRRRPIDDQAILYESFFGRGINDCPHALFRHLLRDERFASMQHYWSLESLEENPAIARYASLDNVHFVARNSEQYVEILATAKYLVNNVTFPTFFSKREGQVYLNTWHGTPIKSMGYKQVGGIVASANVFRNFLHADYLLAENEIMTDMYLDSYKMRGIFPGTILEEGYPRADLTLAADKGEVLGLLAQAGIEVDPTKKIVMYAPTWRESEYGAVINPDELLEFEAALRDQLDPDEYQVLIKPHQFVYNAVKDNPLYQGRFVPSYVDTNEVLSIVDVLVSDFSSIIFDFLVLGRPIVFFIPEIEDYMETRGLDMTVDDLPGPHIDRLEDVAACVASADAWFADYQQGYQALRDSVCPYDDGQVSKRVVDAVLLGEGSPRSIGAATGKRKLLISGGDIYLNGITRSLISLLKQIDYDSWDVTVFVNWTKPELRYLFDEMDQRARVLVRTGAFARDRHEDALIEACDDIGATSRLAKLFAPSKAYEREYHRCLGSVHFDRAVDFNGYVRQLSSMVAYSGADKTFVWLHNDIYEDMNKVVNGERKNYKPLAHTVSLFPAFDGVISCGEQVMLTNREKLATSETYGKFGYAHNLIDADRIRGLLKEGSLAMGGAQYYCEKVEDNEAFDTMLIALPRSDAKTFINVGRMSTEKNQLALIRAFARVHAERADTELFVLGDGPLYPSLVDAVEELGVADAVHLTGNVRNPFLFMERADCFILPSTHEGQPLVVLEARTCGLPIIVGNFSTVEGILIEDGQLLIETDEDSICEGMHAFLRGDVPVVDFSIDDYNREVYQEFERAIR